MQMTNGPYFKREELFETIQNTAQKYDPSLPLDNTRYVYQSTGAVYQGQMRGGFRDGKGTMTWADGAKYEGEWKMGYACGNGKFLHADGDVYEG
jgi:hypothetical protein